MRVDIWSDVVCPWCYIGKRRFERAVAELGDLEVDVTHRAFQLDPTAPPGTTTAVVDAYAKKFGGEQRANEIIDKVSRVAAEEGIEFDMAQALRANTFDAHRLLWWAGQPGNGLHQPDVNEALMRAYFSEGRDVGDSDVLATIAAETGGSDEDTATFLASDVGATAVADDLAAAGDAGISAVPTFVINDTWAIPGAQDTAVFVKVLRKLAAKSPTG